MTRKQSQSLKRKSRKNNAVWTIILTFMSLCFATVSIFAATVAVSNYMALDVTASTNWDNDYKAIVMPAVASVVFAIFPLLIGGGAFLNYWRRLAFKQPYDTVSVVNSSNRSSPAPPNCPDAMRGQKPPREAVIVADARMHWALIAFFILMGSIFFVLGWYSEDIHVAQQDLEAAPWDSTFIGYFFMGLGSIILYGFVRTIYIESRRIIFIATREGVYFHRIDKSNWQAETSYSTRWIWIPWSNVVDVKQRDIVIKGVKKQTDSFEFYLRVTPEQAEEWFPALSPQNSDEENSVIVTLPIRVEWTEPGMCVQLQELKLDAA